MKKPNNEDLIQSLMDESQLPKDFYKRQDKIRSDLLLLQGQGQQTTESLLNLLSNTISEDVRSAVASALSVDQSEKAAEGLIAALKSEDPDICSRAAMALIDYRSQDVTQALIEYIKRNRMGESFEYAIMGLKGREESPELVKLLQDIITKRFVPKSGSGKELGSGLLDRYRRDAIDALATYSSSSASKDAFMVAIDDQSWFVVQHALKALTVYEKDDKEVTKAILARLNGKSFPAYSDLQKFEVPDNTPMSKSDWEKKFVDSRMAGIKEAAALALKNNLSTKVTEGLLDVVYENGNYELRNTLIKILSERVYEPSVREAFEELLSHEATGHDQGYQRELLKSALDSKRGKN